MPSDANMVKKESSKDGNKERNTQPASAAGQDSFLRPPVDVIEDASGITLLADLPGVPRDKLRIELESDSLTIEGEVALDLPQDMQSNLAEVSTQRYRRVFTLSKELDAEKAAAELKNGVLRLHIPKAQHAQPRRIEIRA